VWLRDLRTDAILETLPIPTSGLRGASGPSLSADERHLLVPGQDTARVYCAEGAGWF
jgi:hypothetical protein